MSNYYYIDTSLPPLQIGIAPEISFEEFIRLLKENLDNRDFKQVIILNNYYDVINLRALLLGEDLDPHGNFDKVYLEEALTNKEGLPKHILTFFDSHEHKEDQIKYFPELIAYFYRNEQKDACKFVENYLAFERNLRLVLTGFRAVQLHRDLSKELQFENPDEDIITQILSQKDAATFDPPEGFEDLKALYLQHYQNPLEMHKALCEYRFQKIEDMLGLQVNTLDRILGYMAQLIIVEKWQDLDKKKGLIIVDNIMKESS